MKIYITTLSIFIAISMNAQIKGNKIIDTKTFQVSNLRQINVHLYANIVIDPTLNEEITITTDNNLFRYIQKEVKNGKLDLNQKEWIQPSEPIKITIGAPKLERVETNTHRNLKVINLNQDKLNAMALVGKITLKGKVENLSIGAEIGSVDASQLIAKNVNVNIWGYGKAVVYAENELDSNIKNDARLEIVNTPKILRGNSKKVIQKTKESRQTDVSWIKFKIKNNSWNRNNFFVVGPKKNGSKFSYGFPMMPGSSRKENWSVGTKVYKVNKLGLRKFLVEISSADENQTVKLFQ